MRVAFGRVEKLLHLLGTERLGWSKCKELMWGQGLGWWM